MSDTGALRLDLAKLETSLVRMLETVDAHVEMELQEWREQVKKRVTPDGNTTTDKRWTNPSMTSEWQLRETQRRKTELHRKYEPGIEKLEGKIARLKCLLGIPVPVASRGASPGSIHPTVYALTERMVQATPQLRSAVNGFIARNGLALSAIVSEVFGSHLQLVELFAGIGGLGSGLEASLDAISIIQAERVLERRVVLNTRFPLSLKFDDVHALLNMPRPVPANGLVVAGGFPCRGASRANIHGVTGMENPQTGLWSVMADVIRAWKPIAVITENVVSLRSRGLDIVLRDLVNAGYAVLWGRLEASAFGAPHERARMFCIGIREDAPPVTIRSRAPKSAWLPWSSEIPANDHKAPAKKARVAALGDSVVPIVAYTVGLVAAKLLGGWRPESSSLKPASLSDLPTNGWIVRDRVFALRKTPYEPTVPVRQQRWVTFDERFESPETPLDSCTYPPGIGRISWWDGESDNVDIELPGGEIMPVPPEWVKHGSWPTAVSCDARNLGARGQYERNSPSLNALVQTDAWIAEDGMLAPELLLNVFGGRGIGPSFLEWMLGFPPGWTLPMVEAAEMKSRVKTGTARAQRAA